MPSVSPRRVRSCTLTHFKEDNTINVLYNNFIADAFRAAIDFIYGMVGSYGWSIVIITVCFRLLILPLDIKQKKNTKKQQALQPQIQALQKKYANDKDKLNQKTMELYKANNFNPMSGCLPLLIQMPVFFAFFGALRQLAGEQVFELFNFVSNGGIAGITDLESFLWIKNIWQSDTLNAGLIPEFSKLAQYTMFKDGTVTEAMYNGAFAATVENLKGLTNGFYILPVAAGALSFAQSKLSMPTPKDDGKKKADETPNPMSGKTMQYIMPAMSFFICLSSSAAFALYWSISNLVSVVNYLVMNKVLNAKEEEQMQLAAIEEETKSRKMDRKLPKI